MGKLGQMAGRHKEVVESQKHSFRGQVTEVVKLEQVEVAQALLDQVQVEL